MNLIRKYKISKLLNQPLMGVEGEIISFIKDWLSDLNVVKLDKYPDSIFWFKKERYVLKQESENDYLYVRYENFWAVLQTKYLMNYTNIQILIKYMIEEVFKQQVKTPTPKWDGTYQLIEEVFKQQVKTPHLSSGGIRYTVEEAFKQQVKTNNFNNE